MNSHNKNFEDKLNALYGQQKLTVANAEKLDVYDEKLDGYIAYRIRKFMNKAVDPSTGETIYYSKGEYIFDRIKSFIPDMTMQRLMEILSKMQRHGFLVLKEDYYYSVKASMANMPLI